ncbi:hypothetical protein JCM10908_006965 [Rhodotorula pacifica]|uniref:uncharacterized protein n=1 Tax=Rhodotorula pacifica TaxID=1495444 RepID=UPI003179D54C
METPEQHQSSPVTAAPSTASSPTAARLASGRAVPRPLDLSGSGPAHGSAGAVDDQTGRMHSGELHAAEDGTTAEAGSDEGLAVEADAPAAAAEGSGSEEGNMPTAPSDAYTRRDPRRFGNSSFPKRSPRPTTTLPSPNRPSTFVPNTGKATTRQGGLSYTASGAPSPRRTPSTVFNQSKSTAETVPNPGSRFLLTVVPPTHLPHDPPHPRANPQASGYGPPEHFRRGTLIPLYPTLSSQLAAIAREYGLPSSGGLVLYLLSTVDPATQAPLPQAAGLSGESGPRIGDHAWNMLWGQLLAEEEAERQHSLYGSRRAYDSGSEDEEGEETDDLPPVPPIPHEHSQNRIRRSSIGGTDSSDDAEGSALRDGSASTDLAAVRAAPTSSTAAQAALGRGMPASTPPNGKQARRIGSLPTLSHRNSSRHSLRTASATKGGLRVASSSYLYGALPASANTASSGYSHRSVSYSPSVFSSNGGPHSAPILPTYGSSVVVGKVEFDVHSSSRQGKWYESWLASANTTPPSSQPMSQTASEASSTQQQLPASESRHELRLPSMLAHQMPGRRAGFIAQPFTFPRKRNSDISRDGASSADGGEAVSTAAGHGHSESTASEASAGGPAEEDTVLSHRLADSSIETPRPFHSRKPSSVVSRTDSSISPEERQSAETRAEDSGYAPLMDGEDDPSTIPSHLQHARTASSQSRAGDESDNTSRFGADRRLSDPLGDVFGSDEVAWQRIAGDEALPRQTDHAHDGIVSTGLGIAEAARIAGFPTAPGVAERSFVDAPSAQNSEVSLPQQDDIAEVAALLSPTTVGPPGGSALLASPIRLDSAKEAASETGVFTTTSEGEKRASSFIPTHATRRSISTVNFTVRPASSSRSSRSPDELSQRVNRHGWTEVPTVGQPSMSTSTSISSIAGLTEESAVSGVSATASSIGLERNLNDLERALAELSPARSYPARMANVPSSSAADEPSSVASSRAEEGPTVAAPSAEPASPQPNSLLSTRQPFRYGVSGGSPVAETFAQRVSPPLVTPSADAIGAAPSTLFVPGAGSGESSVDSGRIPRSSSLRKPEPTEPHLIALPPSPIPTSTATFSPIMEEFKVPDVPAIPSASPSWPEPTSLPFQAANVDKAEERELTTTSAPPVDDAAPAVQPAPLDEAKPQVVPTPEVQSERPAVPDAALPPAVPAPATTAPPTSTAKAEAPSAPTQASPGRSPGRLKKLRTGMWGSKTKASDSPKEQQPKAKLTVETPKEVATEEASGAKSPGLGSFFGRFGKKQPRKSDPSTSTTETTDEEVPVPASAETPATTDTEGDEADSSPHNEYSERKKSLEDSEVVNVAGIGRVRTMSVASMRSPESPQLSLPPFPPSLARHISLATTRASPTSPNGGVFTESLDEDADAEETRRLKAVLSPTAAPFVPSVTSAPSTPRPSQRSEESQASTSPSAFPPPPPILGNSTSSHSAPVTPAGWSLSTPRQRMRSKHRLSADIDQLLSQMHDIEFGLDGDDNDEEKEARQSVLASKSSATIATIRKPEVSRSPVLTAGSTSLAYQVPVGSVSPTSPALQLSSLARSPLEGASAADGAEAGERPSSADLLALGSIMTHNLASPPLSPDTVPPVGKDAPPFSAPTPAPAIAAASSS